MRPSIDSEMVEASVEALQNEKLVMGESVYKFEEEFARFCGTRFAVSTGSGTAAIQIGLQALGIGNGDNVLTTPFSFIATANAVIHAEAKPEFADVEALGFNLDPDKAARKISQRTRAIIPVHLYGHPSRMREFQEIAEENDVSLLEDACQAHGAEINGRRAGSLGDVACFSFYTSKNMTVAGDGGMIVTDDDSVAEAARSLRDCGRASKYVMSRIGYTSRLNTVNAAIGRVQLRRLEDWNKARRKVADLYRKNLEETEELVLPPKDGPGSTSVYHLFVIRSRHRDRIARKLEEHGVESGVHYPVPIHLQEPYRRLYGYAEDDFPESEKLARQVLSLPTFPTLAESDIQLVSQIVKDACIDGSDSLVQ